MNDVQEDAQYIVFRRIKPYSVVHYEFAGLFDTYEEAKAAVTDPFKDWIVTPVIDFNIETV